MPSFTIFIKILPSTIIILFHYQIMMIKSESIATYKEHKIEFFFLYFFAQNANFTVNKIGNAMRFTYVYRGENETENYTKIE